MPATRDAKALNQALGLIYFAYRKVIEEPDRILAGKGLGRVHHRILYFIARNQELSIGDLRHILGVSKQALHGPLAELVRLRFVATAPAQANRRLKLLRLTKEGAALEDLLSGIQRQTFARAFAAVGPRQAQGWRTVMEQLADGDPFGSDRVPPSSPR